MSGSPTHPVRRLRAAALALALLVAGPAAAQGLDAIVGVEVLPGWRTAEGRHMAGVRIRLAPGWKTYWRAPGDAGIPPLFDWAGSENLTGAAFHWPVPDVTWQNGMRTIGYSGEVTIPVELSLADPAAPARMAGRVQLGVCQDVCVPAELGFTAVLPASGGDRDPAILASLVDQPVSAAEAGVGPVRCEVTPIDGGLRLTASLEMDAGRLSDVVVIEAGDPRVWVSEPDVRLAARGLTAVSELLHVDGGPFALDRSAVRITVLAGDGAVDIRGCSAG